MNMKKLWLSEFKNIQPVYSGTVIKILPGNKNGFIKYNNRTIYFKTSAVMLNSRVKEKDKVTFCITPSYNKAKEEE
jgi:hypothetical protein